MLDPNAGPTSRHADTPKSPTSVRDRTEVNLTRESSTRRAGEGREPVKKAHKIVTGALYVNDYIFTPFHEPSASNPRGRLVTIKDVAREANVSVATVSRVLNDSGPVSEDTRRLIREVAGRMRYVPHSGARSLITSKTETLGVLLPDLYGEFFSEVIRGMDNTAQRNGFHLVISRAYADRHGIETAIRAMRGRVDGVVAMSPDL